MVRRASRAVPGCVRLCSATVSLPAGKVYLEGDADHSGSITIEEFEKMSDSKKAR